MGGILDWLKEAFRKAAPPVPGLPAPPELPGLPPPPGGLMVPPARPAQETLPSIFEAFAPRPPVPAAPTEAPLMFRAFAPPPALPAPPPEEAAPPIWEAIFAPPAGAPPEVPVAEMFAPFAPPPPPTEAPAAPPPQPVTEEGFRVPSAVPATSRLVLPPGPLVPLEETADWTREFPDIAEETQGRMPLWVVYDLGWQVPPTWAIVQMVERSWDLPLIFEQALSASADPWFRRTAQEAAHTGEPAELEIEEVGRWGDPYRDVAKFLGIPERVIEAYLRQPAVEEMFWQEVLGPYLRRLSRAMEFVKPPGLRGWFEIAPSADGSFWLKYREVGSETPPV